MMAWVVIEAVVEWMLHPRGQVAKVKEIPGANPETGFRAHRVNVISI